MHRSQVVLDVLLCLLIGALLGLAPAGWLATQDYVPDTGTARLSTISGPAQPVALRPLPAFDPEGPLSHAFPDGAGVADAAAVRRFIDAQATRLGMADWMPAIWDELRRDDLPLQAGYPFRFPSLDPLFSSALPDDVMADHSADVNELAVGLIFAASYHNDVESPVYGSTDRAAFSLLNRLRTIRPTCQTQLNLAFLVSTDVVARDDTVADEFRSATESCGDDLTPQWRLGQFQVGRAYVERNPLMTQADPGRQALIDRALATFRAMQTQHPTSPLGWMGEADLWSKLAESRTDLEVEPFTAREQYRRALVLYERVERLSEAPIVQSAKSRALTGLSRFDESSAAAQEALRRDPRNPTVNAVALGSLFDSRDFSAVIDLTRREDIRLPTGLSLAAAGPGRPTDLLAPTLGLDDAITVSLTLGSFDPEGGGTVTDYSFLPEYRPFDDVSGWCRVSMRQQAQIISGAPVDVLRDADAGVDAYSFVENHGCDDSTNLVVVNSEDSFVDDLTAGVAAIEAKNQSAQAKWIAPNDTPSQSDPLSVVLESRQNIWRRVGRLDTAEVAAREWVDQLPGDPYAHDRLGEIHYLRGDFDPAAAAFGAAAELFQAWVESGAELPGDEISPRQEPELERAHALLKRGAALEQSGRPAEAREQYQRAAQFGRDLTVDEYVYWPPRLRLYALGQLGNLELASGDVAAAVRAFDEALVAQKRFDRADPVRGEPDEVQPDRLQKGALENNLALALTNTAERSRAITVANAARARDPASPVFSETLAYAQTVGGQETAAIATYDAALASDATLFSAANNRGVLLAHQGQPAAAASSLRQAVSSNPASATAWANLALVLSDSRPIAGFVEAQGAAGRAAKLDPSLRGHEPTQLRLDNAIYDTGLDLSRPLPPQWAYNQTATPPISGLSALAILLVVTRVAWALTLDLGGSRAGEILLRDRSSEVTPHRLGLLARPAPAALGLIVTALLVYTSQQTLWPPSPAGIAVLIGSVALAGAFLRIRQLRAGPTTPITHQAWVPALAFGGVTSLAGLTFFPVPHLVPASVADPRIRWSGHRLLAALAVVCLLATLLTGNPVLRALGVNGTALVASTLLPIVPFDGAYFRKRVTAAAVTILLLVGTVALALRWL